MKRTISVLWDAVTVAEAKAHIQGLESITSEDAYIGTLIAAAREVAEAFMWRTIVQSTYELRLSSFSERIILPAPPAIAITSIKYIDTAGDEQTLDASAYKLIDFEEPGFVIAAPGTSWPETRGADGDITITFTAGYAAAANVPAAFKQAILLMVRTWFDHRENVTNRTVNEMPKGSEFILRPWRCNRF